jgi:phage N-6-adenine-methyltransferase
VNFVKTTKHILLVDVIQIANVVTEKDIRMSYKELQTSDGSFNTPKYLFRYLDNFFHFEIDPCDSGNNWLGLTYTFTKGMHFDGLKQEWNGSTFVNPPYGNENENTWIAKGFQQYGKHGKTIFFLLPAKTESNWFSSLMINADIIIFPRPRVSFVRDNKVINGNNIGSVIFGLREKTAKGVQQVRNFILFNSDELDVDYDIIGDDRYILYPDLKKLKNVFEDYPKIVTGGHYQEYNHKSYLDQNYLSQMD